MKQLYGDVSMKVARAEGGTVIETSTRRIYRTQDRGVRHYSSVVVLYTALAHVVLEDQHDVGHTYRVGHFWYGHPKYGN